MELYFNQNMQKIFRKSYFIIKSLGFLQFFPNILTFIAHHFKILNDFWKLLAQTY